MTQIAKTKKNKRQIQSQKEASYSRLPCVCTLHYAAFWQRADKNKKGLSITGSSKPFLTWQEDKNNKRSNKNLLIFSTA